MFFQGSVPRVASLGGRGAESDARAVVLERLAALLALPLDGTASRRPPTVLRIGPELGGWPLLGFSVSHVLKAARVTCGFRACGGGESKSIAHFVHISHTSHII